MVEVPGRIIPADLSIWSAALPCLITAGFLRLWCDRHGLQEQHSLQGVNLLTMVIHISLKYGAISVDYAGALFSNGLRLMHAHDIYR